MRLHWPVLAMMVLVVLMAVMVMGAPLAGGYKVGAVFVAVRD